jgi:hypothetical protein
VLAVLWFAVPAALAEDPTPRDVSNQLVLWGTLLQSGQNGYGDGKPFKSLEDHAKAMAALYSKDATLLPTVRDGVWTQGGLLTIENYFKEDFLKKKPVLFKVDVDNPRVLCKTHGLNDGLYTFDLDELDGAGKVIGRKRVQARYTFAYSFGGATRIIHHHSSLNPKEPLIKWLWELAPPPREVEPPPPMIPPTYWCGLSDLVNGLFTTWAHGPTNGVPPLLPADSVVLAFDGQTFVGPAGVVAAFATLAEIETAAGTVAGMLDLVPDSLEVDPRDGAVWLRGLYHYELPGGPLPVSFEFQLVAPEAADAAADPVALDAPEINKAAEEISPVIAP